MNIPMILRYGAELAMIIPTAVMAILPVREGIRINKPTVFTMLVSLILVVIAGGSVLCSFLELPSNAVIFPSMILFFIVYHIAYDQSVSKKLFCFFNASMLCAFCTVYTTLVTAPVEQQNKENVFLLSSGLTCLGIAVLIGAVFAKTLLVKIPAMLENDSLNRLWKFMSAVTVAMTVMLVWINPVSAENVMIGRLRPISMAVLLLIPLAIWFLNHIMWRIDSYVTENAQLQQNYNILKLEEKQYHKTLRYLEENERMRHDFRQHLLVINEFAQGKEYEKLTQYIYQFISMTEKKSEKYCENYAVNAIAAHYANTAHEQGIVTRWSLNLPETIPIKESDLCALIGNLIENAVHAVCNLPEEKRIIQTAVTFRTGKTIIISVCNPYEGYIPLDKQGLPCTVKTNRRIGLKSVSNTVERYEGSMVIKTENKIFDVSIVLNIPE